VKKRDDQAMLFTVVSVVAAVICLVSAVIAGRAYRLQRIQQRKGPELFIHFEPDTDGFQDLLVLENVGEVALETDIAVFIDPKEDDRYPKESKQVWVFRRRLYPGRPVRWMHSFQVVLNEMGYRQDCTYMVRFKGAFWPLATGEQFKRDHFQEYKIISTTKGWLYVEQSDEDWYYADHREEINLKRSGIPEELRKENEFRTP